MGLKQSRFKSDMVERKEKIENVLARLRSLKLKVSELRLQLETLRKLQSERQEKALLCDHCGKAIRQGTEIMIKGSLGEIRSSYHEGCFKAFLSS
jgi:prefoldin subunit 5